MTFQDKAPLWLKQILFPSLRQHKQLVVFKRAAILVWILLKKKKEQKHAFLLADQKTELYPGHLNQTPVRRVYCNLKKKKKFQKNGKSSILH